MKPEDQQAIALARYAVIAPLVTGQLDEYQKVGDFYAAASRKGVMFPDGTMRHPAASTIQHWYLNYKKADLMPFCRRHAPTAAGQVFESPRGRENHAEVRPQEASCGGFRISYPAGIRLSNPGFGNSQRLIVRGDDNAAGHGTDAHGREYS